MMLKDKFGAVFGVANRRSIAWACAQACTQAGARLAFNYQGERLKENVEKLTADMQGVLRALIDVTSEEEVAAFFEKIKSEFGNLDFLFHSIAFAPQEAM